MFSLHLEPRKGESGTRYVDVSTLDEKSGCPPVSHVSWGGYISKKRSYGGREAPFPPLLTADCGTKSCKYE